MRLMSVLLPFWGIVLSGCVIIPARIVKPKEPGEMAKFERPSVGMKPFGDDGGQFRLRYSHNKKEAWLEYRKDF